MTTIKSYGNFLSLQKAFDTVDYKILLAKLHNYGIRGIIYSLFKNYLTDRMQSVSDSGVSSQTRYITCGVPQGSVLWPLLFLIYTNDTGNSISGIPIKLFAYDTILFIFSQSIDPLKADTEDKIKLLNSWFVANKLSLSLDKTYYTRSTDTEKSKIHLKMNDVEIKQVDCSKYLGILIDSKLTCQNHSHCVYNKLIKFTSILLPRDAMHPRY